MILTSFNEIKKSFNILLALFFIGAFSSVAAEIEWPKEVSFDKGNIIVYQPQPEKLEGNLLTGRSAMALEIAGKKDPIFGVFWFEAHIDTDQEKRTATIYDVNVKRVRWPDSKDTEEQKFTQLVESAIPKAGFTISLERLSASLATAEQEITSLDGLNNEAPQLVFEQQLSVLLMFDGEPKFSDIEKSGYQRAVNTPFLVIKDKNKSQFYMFNGAVWFAANSALGPWASTMSVPTEVVKVLPKTEDGKVVSHISSGASFPKIVVATTASELIVSDGKPKWEAVSGGELLYVKNTETPWLRHIESGNMYLLLSGRWFRAKNTSGPWTFVRADKLPNSFSSIPSSSDIGGIRSSIAGTPEANEAILDAQIPQTAAIRREDASTNVEYSGAPEFKKISGTDVAYAVNTSAQVLEIRSKFYVVDNGIWFVSNKAKGPWGVADTIPADDISKIPPSSPVYNTTYVHVYHSTPEVVYVGYTPGYMWSFPYHGVPVYGSGWYYPPYRGVIYYPRPPTWGFHVGYNPWTGWNYGVSWSHGFFSVGVTLGHSHHHNHGCCGSGWYGGGYRAPVIINTGNINTGNINIGNNINSGNRKKFANDISKKSGSLQRGNVNRPNLYNSQQGNSKRISQESLKQNFRTASPAKGRLNNVYADKDGRVVRNLDNNWQIQQNKTWEKDSSLNTQKSRQGLSDRSYDFSNKKSRVQSNGRQSRLNNARNARQSGSNRERSAARSRRR